VIEAMSALDLRGVRVYIDRDVHNLFEELVSRSDKLAEDHPFATMKDVFMVAACLGAQRNRHEALGASREIFSGETFDARTDVPVLAALTYRRTEDLDTIADPKKVVEIAQEWANAGIYTLVNEELIDRPGLRPLFKLTDLILDQPLIQ
jgi:dnd system-associated protein 4